MKKIIRDRFSSFDEWAKAYNSEYWNYLKLLELVEPGLPIVEMHDKFAADIAAVEHDTIEQMIAIETLAGEYREDMRNLALAYRSGDQDEIDRLCAKYPIDRRS